MEVPNLETKQFLENYHKVLCHHVDYILKSRMLLDEDMHLLLTFWDPNVFVKESNWLRNVVTSATYTTIGLLVSVKMHNLYPLTIAILPATVQLCQNMKICYFERKYKHNFEKLLSTIFELYELSRNILEYYHKRDTAVQDCKMPNEAFTILLTPGEEFLRCTTSLLVEILEKIRSTMLEICKLVPLSQGEYISSLEWNLEDFKRPDCKDFKELQHQFQKLTDLYVLVISNFLSCVGLSFCVQLWKETSCSFKNIFDNLIPELSHFLEASLVKIKMHFNRIRFTLYNTEDEILKKQRENRKSTNNVVKLQRPLADFLANVQVTFETAMQLQLLLDQSDLNVELENFSPLVESIRNQNETCGDSLNAFFKLFCLLTKQSVTKKVNSMPLAAANNESKISAEIHFDDPVELLEDEEYNLSVHGSDVEDSVFPLYDYADQCSTEHLELMLCELKRKLEERKGGRDKTQDDQDTRANSSEHHTLGIKKSLLTAAKTASFEERATPVPPPMPLLLQNSISVSVPPPPPVIDQLPTVDNFHIDFLDAVKTVAQKLNRDEEVFGSDAIISSDSDDS